MNTTKHNLQNAFINSLKISCYILIILPPLSPPPPRPTLYSVPTQLRIFILLNPASPSFAAYIILKTCHRSYPYRKLTLWEAVHYLQLLSWGGGSFTCTS